MNGPFRGAVFGLIAGLIAWVLIAIAVIALSGKADAAPLCEPRDATHQAEHGGFAVDSAWHVAHGQLPTCGTDSSAHKGDEHEDDDKSRFCRKRWYC